MPALRKAPQVLGSLWDPAGIRLCPGALLSAFALNPPRRAPAPGRGSISKGRARPFAPPGGCSSPGSLQPPKSPSHSLSPPTISMCHLKRAEVAERRKTGTRLSVTGAGGTSPPAGPRNAARAPGCRDEVPAGLLNPAESRLPPTKKLLIPLRGMGNNRGFGSGCASVCVCMCVERVCVCLCVEHVRVSACL